MQRSTDVASYANSTQCTKVRKFKGGSMSKGQQMWIHKSLYTHVHAANMIASNEYS